MFKTRFTAKLGGISDALTVIIIYFGDKNYFKCLAYAKEAKRNGMSKIYNVS